VAYKDEDKVPLQTLDPRFIEGMAWVQSLGDKKHKDHHWTRGVSVNEILGAIKRHIADIEKGEYFDKESTLQHAYHAACGLQYIAHYVRNSEKYAEFFDQPFGGPPNRGGNLGRRHIPNPLDPGYFDKTTRRGSGAVQGSERGGAGGRDDPNLGLVSLSRGPAWSSGDEENED